jgi:ABC-type multidrug transport system fused ATPase/permease subunit
MQNSFLINSIRISLTALDKPSRIKYLLVVGFQGTLAFLDLLGVAILGAIGALAIRGIQSQPAGSRVGDLLEITKLTDLTFQQQVATLGLIAVSLLVLKTLLSIWITRKTLHFLAFKGTQLSAELFHNCLFSTENRILRRKIEEIQYAIGAGANSLTVGTLGTLSSLISDLFVVVTVGVGAFLIDPTTSLYALILFGSVALILYKSLHLRARNLGTTLTSASISTDESVSQAVIGFRELYTKNSRQYYSEKVRATREKFGSAYADQNFLPNISKYVIEIALIVGALTIAAIQFMLYDSSKAAASLTLFLAAGSRVGPALLRFQQNLVSIQSFNGSAEPTLSLIREFQGLSKPASKQSGVTGLKFKGALKVENLSFSYSNKRDLINNLSFEVNEGEFLAIVGPSGAGKSTLIDLMLGITKPLEGQIKISGIDPESAIQEWPGKIAYVPQDSFLINGTIKENITFGFNDEVFNSEDLNYAVTNSLVDAFVKHLPDHLETRVQERGTSLSGGQKQRIGIARALITRPGILFLDEATSSLDSVSELEITNSIQNIKKNVTLVVVAHRLSTIIRADKFIYISKEVTVQTHSFKELRTLVPEFDIQAKLMGL